MVRKPLNNVESNSGDSDKNIHSDQSDIAKTVLDSGFNNFIKLSSNFICVTDFDGRFIIVNGAVERILGYKPEEVIGHTIFDFLHPDDQAKTTDELTRSTTENCDHSFENRYITKENDTVCLKWQSTPDKKLGVIYALAEDVTTYKKTASELSIFKNMAN